MNKLLFISGKDQLDRFIEKIQKRAEIKQEEAIAEQLTAQQEETSKLLAEQKVFYCSYPEKAAVRFQ